ncbi:hypothetical protein CEV34_4554 [Brucella pseudogrignonensis]|uniref:Uncharacterized protein n=1 Tax=Brucella pseudogrignonensis TaxID=419475 RepID=A0A256G543_9HYPH|nr:hypothetical protein CEV34_4554 [Brucella pseudogrignonensis]
MIKEQCAIEDNGVWHTERGSILLPDGLNWFPCLRECYSQADRASEFVSAVS